MKNKIIKPSYEIYPNLNCAVIVYVNDVPVFEYLGDKTIDGIYDGSVPINHILLESGKYEVKGVMYPRHKQNSLTENDGMSIEFNLSDIDNWKETKHSFHPELSTPDAFFDKNGAITNVYKGLDSYIIKTTIDVTLPFKLKGWQNSINLKELDQKRLQSEVFEAYTKIHSLLKTYNASEFIEVSKDKEKLQSEGFYFNKEKENEIRSKINQVFNKKLEVKPLDFSKLKLNIFGYGKLVNLLNPDGSSPIVFFDPIEPEIKVEFDIKLHKKSLRDNLTII
ncbi:MULTISPECIES: hypothetical protein [Flavobacterium]|uniref:Uncharacterized protein n=1 Tax=Flavobacterium hankyongi TaxID=1176532 RepID=A0ABP8ZJJ8_9FLAO|nr:hypothetical protein [Flavobacterium sp. N1846]